MRRLTAVSGMTVEGGVERVTRRLRELSEAALAAAATDDVVDLFVAAARDLLAVDQVHVIEVSQDGTVGHARAFGYGPEGRREDAYVMVLDDRPSGTTRVVASGEVLHVPDAPTSNALRRDYSDRFGVRCALFVPLAWGGDVRQVTVLIRTDPTPFDDGEIELARLMASVAAAAMARLEIREQQQATSAADAALARAAAALNISSDLATVLSAITREADRAVGGDMAGIYLGDATQGGVATAGHNTPEGWLGYVMKPGEGVGGRVLASGRPAITNAYQTDVRMPENLALRDLKTAVAVPLVWDGAVRGALSVGFTRMRRVTPNDLRTLEAFADLAAVACQHERRAARLASEDDAS